MRDPRRRLHPYLFEHHPEKNFRSYIATMIAGLWPPRFWRRLHPLQRVDSQRLVLYWKISAAALVFSVASFVVMMVVQFNVINARARASELAQMARDPRYNTLVKTHSIPIFGSIDRYFDVQYPMGIGPALRLQRTQLFWTLALALQVLIWPWLSYLSLVNFRQSMKLVDKGRPHVLRCCIYSLDIVTWITAFVFFSFASWRVLLLLDGLIDMLYSRGWTFRIFPSQEMGPLFCASLIAMVACVRLYVAYKRYMQFPNPAATVVASQILAFLLVLNILILYVWIL
jgi:hypothetical protein